MRRVRPGRDGARATVLLVLLATVWTISPPAGVPLYDGVGFPDEPYRSVPAVGGTPPATAAQVELPLTRGVNPGGMIANSAERGPQVSVFAPPQAFQVAAAPAGARVLVRAEPVAPAQPPPGRLQSNVYRITVRSPAGPVTVNPQAQPLGVSLRAVNVDAGGLPVMQYRPDLGSPWRLLETKQVGADVFTAPGPGAGDYVLASAVREVPQRSDTALLGIVAVAMLALIVALVGVRRAQSRRVRPPSAQENQH